MAHKSYSRMSRVNPLIQQVIAETVEQIDDDDLVLVTITGCEVAPDLRHAKVFISKLGSDEERQKALDALDKYKGKIKRAMSSQITMKFLPDLHFMFDPSTDAGWGIEKLIKEVHERDGVAVRDDSLEDQ